MEFSIKDQTPTPHPLNEKKWMSTILAEEGPPDKNVKTKFVLK